MRRSFSNWFALLVFGIFCVAQTGAIAADPPAMITKDYDLTDVLIGIPDFTDAPDMGTVREQAKEEPVRAQTQPEKDQVEELAKSMASWMKSLTRANEPAIGVERDNKKFTVTATSEQHERVARRIAEMLAQRSKQVTIETRFICLGRKSEAVLPPAVVEKLELVRLPGQRSAGTQLDDAAANAISDAVPNDPDSSTITAPRVTLCNGQRAYVLVGTQRSFVSGFTKKADTDEWEQKVDVVQTGLLLDARCRTDDAGEIVAVDLKPQLSRLLEMHEEPFKDAPAQLQLKVQVPTMDTRKLDALLSMPAGKTMLFYIPGDPNVAKDADQRLYVLMKATVLRP